MGRRPNVKNKKEFVRYVYYGIEKKRKDKLPIFVMEDIFDCLLDNITECILRGEYVYLRGFGTFHPLKSAMTTFERGWNPGTKVFEKQHRIMSNKVFRSSRRLLTRVNMEDRDVFETYFNDSTTS